MDTTSSAAPEATSRSGLITAALGAILVVVALIFALNSVYSNWYAIFRVVHVALAVFWVGGGVTLAILGLKAERASDPHEISTLASQAAFVGERFFAPAGLVVLLSGIGMVLNGDLGWNHFWVIAALVGYASTFVTGIAVLTPLAKQIKVQPDSLTLIRRILLIVRVDVTVLLLVVADMVLKPFS